MKVKIKHPELLQEVSGFDNKGLAIVRYKSRDEQFLVNINMERVSDVGVVVKKKGKKLYSITGEDGKDTFYRFNGVTVEKDSKPFIYCGNIDDYGLSLVVDDEIDGQNIDEVFYFVDTNNGYKRMSPYYRSATEFDKDFEVSKVEDFETRSEYFINRNYQRISPYFNYSTGLDKAGRTLSVINEEGLFVYYQYINGRFGIASNVYKNATPFDDLDVAVVQELEDDKYYIINRDFVEVSDGFDYSTGFIGMPAVGKFKKEGKDFYLTAETLTEVNKPDLYRALYNVFESKGYDSELSAIKRYKEQIGFNKSNKKDIKDLKVAVKDYLTHNASRLALKDKKSPLYIKGNKERSAIKNSNSILSRIEEEVIKVSRAVAKFDNDSDMAK